MGGVNENSWNICIGDNISLPLLPLLERINLIRPESVNLLLKNLYFSPKL